MMRRRRQAPQDVAKECISGNKDQDGNFEVQLTENKGRGVFAKVDISGGDFLVHYAGELISGSEGEKRERESRSVFRYFFPFKGSSYCIDATSEPVEDSHTAKLGRLVNHGERAEINAKMKPIDAGDGNPALCLFAIKTIHAGQEILYDYGVKNLPWKQSEVCYPSKPRCLSAASEVSLGTYQYAGRWSAEVSFLLNSTDCRHVVPGLKYHKTTKIASGSDGAQVYVGMKNNRPVAIKRVNSDFVQHEKEILKLLDGKTVSHVLPVLCCEEDEDFTYFAMELCEYNLGEVIEDGCCPLHTDLTAAKRKEMCTQFLEGVKELHDAGILHRDLKPSNILIDANGKLVISDFGVSRHSICQKTTKVTTAVGTMCWIAKEVLAGSLECRKSADIQVAGFVVYYILSGGHIPHESVHPFIQDPAGVMKNIQDNTFSLHHIRVTFPELENILQRMIHADASNRPDINTCISEFSFTGDDDNAMMMLQSICRGEVPSDIQDNGSILPKHCDNDRSLQTEPRTTWPTFVVDDSEATSVTTSSSQSDDSGGSDYNPGSDKKEMEEDSDDSGDDRRNHPADDDDVAHSDDSGGSDYNPGGDKKEMREDSDYSGDDQRNHPADDDVAHSDDSGGSEYNPGSDKKEMEEDSDDSGDDQRNHPADDDVAHPESDDSEGACHRTEIKQRRVTVINDDSDEVNTEDETNNTKCKSQVKSDTSKNADVSQAVRSSDKGMEDVDPYVASSSSVGPNRVWNKYSYCFYCGEKQTKLIRHLRRAHSCESWVAEAVALEELKKEASHLWSKIRNMGNHEHNKDVHLGKVSDLIVKKRPGKNKTPSIHDYIPCSDCLGYFSCHTLWVHKQSCPERTLTTGRQHVKDGRSLLPLQHDVSEQLRSVVDRMQPDDITLIAKSDQAILAVAEKELHVSNSFKKDETAREKMRTLGRMLQLGRSYDKNISSAEDMVMPSSYDTMERVARKMSGYDGKTQQHQSYSNASRVGFALKDLALHIRSKYIKQGLRDKTVLVDEFLQLRESDWVQVTASARRQGDEKKWRSPKILPLTEDCVNFSAFLAKKEDEVKTHLKKDGQLSPQNYMVLAEVTLVQVILFNRRRPREVDSLTIDQYTDHTTGKQNQIQDEILQSLTISEKVAIDRLTLLMVRGKRGRGVPILLPTNIKESIDELVKFHSAREQEKKEKDEGRYVKKTIFVFNRLSEHASTPIRGYATVGKLAACAGLKQPENMRCVQLRKQIASLSQLLSLKENELEQLATHMGHNINIHKEYYRLPQEALLLAKMSKLLSIAEKGEIHKNKGKSLEEIEIDPEECVAADAHDTEDDDAASDDEPMDGSAGDQVPDNARKYNRWSQSQEKFLLKQPEIKRLVKTGKVPGKITAELMIQRSNGLLADKSWKEIKNKLHNYNKAEKSKLRQQEKKLKEKKLKSKKKRSHKKH